MMRVCLRFLLFFSCPLVLLSSCSLAWLSALPAFLLCLSSLPVLSICVVFVALWVCCWVFFFPCGLYAKRKGAKVLPLVSSLVVCCGLVYMFSASLSVVSFVFENIHPAPQERWLLNLPPRDLSVSLIARVSPTTAIAFSE